METSQPQSRPPFKPLTHEEQMAGLIAEVTGEPVTRVLEHLRGEYRSPGSTVAADFRRRGLTPYMWNDALIQFYQQTDAFLYELALWNRSQLKGRMRRWVTRFLSSRRKDPLDILVLGDGLGFDGLRLAQDGHRVTYFEVPGYSSAFAQRLFERSGEKITMLTDSGTIPRGAFDAVTCLDVLEHVPDPGAMVGSMVEYLRPSGWLLVHAPFYMIHPRYPTHLRANRRFSGDLSLFTRHGLRLVDGRMAWHPLALAKGEAANTGGSALGRALVHLGGMYLKLGRIAMWPFLPVHWVKYVQRRWFK